MIPQILKNFDLFVSYRGKAGVVDEVTLPKLTMKTDEHRAGGMDAPIELEMGMEKMESNFTLSQYDAQTLPLFGLSNGADIPLTFKGALLGNAGLIVPVQAKMRGLLKEVDFGTAKMGDKTQIKFAMAVRYYQLIMDGVVIYEIDIENMVRIVNGVDQLLLERAAIGG